MADGYSSQEPESTKYTKNDSPSEREPFRRATFAGDARLTSFRQGFGGPP
jgi:hypothetical protein